MHTLPQLNYEYNALEPWIDEQTMLIHHTKHHQAYIDKLNAALEKYPDWQSKEVGELLRDLDKLPEEIRTTVKNNAGGHWNHTFFWKILTPVDKFVSPDSVLLEKIKNHFESLENFQAKFKEAALTHFGSGWTWLVLHETGKMKIETSANQDLHTGGKTLLALDVWEHAYYLKYQNRRADYVDAFWKIVNWQMVAELLDSK